MTIRALLLTGCLLLTSVVTTCRADVVVPTGASFSLSGGSLDLGGTNLQASGSVILGSGNINDAANIDIPSGGSLDAGSGTLTLSGNWSNAGSFNAGTSTVNFVDGGTDPSIISGDTTFYNASFISSVGKTYAFVVGSTQTIQGLLTILGTSSQGIQFASTTAAQVAFIDLLQGGSQNIDFVGVSDVHATGQHLAPTKTNDGGTGNDLGWFGNYPAGGGASVAPTPVLSIFAAFLLALILLGSTLFLNRRVLRDLPNVRWR